MPKSAERSVPPERPFTTPPTPAHWSHARRLLTRVNAQVSESASDEDVAAVRAYDEVHKHLSPLVGGPGVDALLVRSAKLTQGERLRLSEISVIERGERLRERLRSDPPISREAAEALFATFFALLATFIGEALTERVLRRAWPESQAAPTGTNRKP
jgi:hypothetical protein